MRDLILAQTYLPPALFFFQNIWGKKERFYLMIQSFARMPFYIPVNNRLNSMKKRSERTLNTVHQEFVQKLSIKVVRTSLSEKGS